MHSIFPAVLASASVVLASPTVFSVHDDVLAFPQYEVIFSDSLISDIEANLIVDHVTSSDPPQSSKTKSIESHLSPTSPPFDPSSETYEFMYLNGEQYLCTIPMVDTPPRNETSEAEARVAEQKELARATDRGWELLQDLEGNCLYFVSGWWSYSFCYNSEITQFHPLPPQPGKPAYPPQRDPTTMQFILGRAKTAQSKEDEWGNQIDSDEPRKDGDPPMTELQVKGDARYLVQKMDGGTTCDLTGKPRRVEVQYHCNPHVADRIGYIKEVTTCSYLMVVYTPRLCNDVAFMPPKETKANAVVCRVIVPEEELSQLSAMKSLEGVEVAATTPKGEPALNVGGITIGGGKFINKEGQRMPIPANFGQENMGRASEVIAFAKSKAEGGQVETVSNEKLGEMDIDPAIIEGLKKELQELAQGKGWKIKVVDTPGEIREILGIVEGEEDEEGEDSEGSEEIYKDEL